MVMIWFVLPSSRRKRADIGVYFSRVLLLKSLHPIRSRQSLHQIQMKRKRAPDVNRWNDTETRNKWPRSIFVYSRGLLWGVYGRIPGRHGRSSRDYRGCIRYLHPWRSTSSWRPSTTSQAYSQLLMLIQPEHWLFASWAIRGRYRSRNPLHDRTVISSRACSSNYPWTNHRIAAVYARSWGSMCLLDRIWVLRRICSDR